MNTAEPITLAELFGEPIHVYTRAQAIADGMLIAADPELCRQVGIRHPVTYTRAAHSDCIAWPEGYGHGQDETGREWDVLWMTRLAISQSTGTRADVELWRVPIDTVTGSPVRTLLIAVCGPGDQAEAVITVMRPDES